MVFRYFHAILSTTVLSTMSRDLSLLLVDDQSLFLDGLESLIGRKTGLAIVGKANDGVQALRLVEELKPDLVLMDINMPNMDGIEASKRMKKVSPDTRVIVLSMYGHREFVLELMDSGVDGYLLKTTQCEEFMEALETVLNGQRYIAKELSQLAKTHDRHSDRVGETKYGPLTKREVEVVRLVLKEYTTQEIADKLFLSVTTVETHRRNILHKLDCRNLAGLVKYAMERGWGGLNHQT